MILVVALMTRVAVAARPALNSARPLLNGKCIAPDAATNTRTMSASGFGDRGRPAFAILPCRINEPTWSTECRVITA
jgi:hypothetical protein